MTDTLCEIYHQLRMLGYSPAEAGSLTFQPDRAINILTIAQLQNERIKK